MPLFHCVFGGGLCIVSQLMWRSTSRQHEAECRTIHSSKKKKNSKHLQLLSWTQTPPMIRKPMPIVMPPFFFFFLWLLLCFHHDKERKNKISFIDMLVVNQPMPCLLSNLESTKLKRTIYVGRRLRFWHDEWCGQTVLEPSIS